MAKEETILPYPVLLPEETIALDVGINIFCPTCR